MDFREHQKLSIREAKEMDMVDYLSRLGYKPAKIRNADYWYLSPLRNEKTPSFKVNRRLNRWYDHGLGKGGNLIDFAIQFENCTIGEFLQKLNSDFSFHTPIFHQAEEWKTEKKLNILQDYSISSFALLRYLEQRRIPIDIADQFCREVRYELNNKIYYGIGFKTIREAMKYETLISKRAVLQKTSRPLKIKGKKPSSLKDFLTFFPSWLFIKIRLQMRAVL